VFDFLQQFDVIKMDYKFLDRETDLHEIPIIDEDVVIPVDSLLSVELEELVSIN